MHIFDFYLRRIGFKYFANVTMYLKPDEYDIIITNSILYTL